MSSFQLLSPEDARELFLWRWKDVTRDSINEHLREFKKFDLLKTGELEENHAMMLLESRGETKTARELRETFSRIDVNNNRKISFLEWCCYIYEKDFTETNSFVDQDARNAAMAEVEKAAEAARAVEEAAAKAKADEEAEAKRRAEELERESQLVRINLNCFDSILDWCRWYVRLFQAPN
jgi:chemotaxis protein histidine kinase CheA